MYTQEQLQTLKDNYAKGILTAELGSEKLTFASGSEMRRRIRDIESQLAGGGSDMTVILPNLGRGY